MSDAEVTRVRIEGGWWAHIGPWCAIIISVLALYVSYDLAKKTTKHNKLLVVPHLELEGDFSLAKESNGIYLKSSGLGPAKIRKFEIWFEGENQFDWIFFAKVFRISGISEIEKVDASILTDNAYLPPGSRVTMFLSPTSNIYSPAAFLKFFTERVAFQVEYCSVYDECQQTCLGGEKTACESKLLKPRY